MSAKLKTATGRATCMLCGQKIEKGLTSILINGNQIHFDTTTICAKKLMLKKLKGE